MENKTQDLYTTKDVEVVRKKLTEEQENCCAITGLEIPTKQHVLDHAHDDLQLVRGVLHRQVNSCIGSLENLHKRYLSYWYPGKLSDFLRQCAAYLEKEQDTRYRHPGWIKKVKTQFNQLNSKQQDKVLTDLGYEKGNNSKIRKEIFAKVVLDRTLGYDTIRSTIFSAKEEL